MADRSGQQIDRYRLIRQLGQGAFGDVYLAENIYRNDQVAMKILNIRLTNEEVPTFLNEARNFRLKNPHIIPIVDFGIDPASNTAFLAMDYAPGGTLRQRHPKGTQVSLATVVHYVKQLASALQYAHEEHLVHRDVKPENMLIGRQQELLLSDFGISVIFQTSHTSLQQSAYRIGGTPYYMAPEQFRGKPQPASDQYALAIVVYEWLTGTPPFTEGDFIQLGYQHNFETPPPFHEKGAAISPEVEQVVLTALAKNPSQRFASMQAFAQALTAVFDKLTAPTVLVAIKEKPPQHTPPVSQKTKEQWVDEGNAHYKAEQYDKAIADYDQALQLDPKYVIAYLGRGIVYQALRQHDKVIADFTQALRLDPKRAFAYYSRGNAYYALQQYDKAVANYDQAIKLDPTYADARKWRQEAYRLLREKR